jgi:hypothetical protein
LLTYNTLLSLIRKYSDATAGNVNRPLTELFDNVEFVKALVDDALLGSGLMAYDQTIDSTLLVGDAVYYDEATGTYKGALAGAEVVNDDVRLTAASRVVGLVYYKHDATTADLLLLGYKTLDLTDALADDALTVGPYYLSTVSAGKLTATRPAICVPVLQHLGQNQVLVSPQVRELWHEHQHYKFTLHARPAGEHTPPGLGDPHVIVNPDEGQRGWLPASHASFGGNAPAGARFGYNLAADPKLAGLWPPVPQSAYLEMDRGEDASMGFQGVPLGSHRLAVIDAHGIWWMSDCYGDVPWPTEYDSSADDPDVSDTSYESECPRELGFGLQLWFSRVQFATSRAVVTSLTSSDPRLRVLCATTDQPASSGPLRLVLDLLFQLSSTTDDTSALAVKTLDEEGKLVRGPVVSRLRSGNARLTVTSSEEADADNNRFGDLILTVNPLETLELPVQLVRVSGVSQEFYPDLYLGFPAGRASEIRGRIDIPVDVEADTITLALKTWLLGRSAGTLPALTAAYRIVGRPSAGLTTPVAFPLTDTAWTVTTSAAVGANEYVEASSATIEVSPGDTVFFSLVRAASDGYSGELGLIRQFGLLALS